MKNPKKDSQLTFFANLGEESETARTTSFSPHNPNTSIAVETIRKEEVEWSWY